MRIWRIFLAAVVAFPCTLAVGALVTPRLAAMVPLLTAGVVGLTAGQLPRISSAERRSLVVAAALFLVAFAGLTIALGEASLQARLASLWPLVVVVGIASAAVATHSKKMAVVFYTSVILFIANVPLGLLLVQA
jgi:hypothetical protein